MKEIVLDHNGYDPSWTRGLAIGFYIVKNINVMAMKDHREIRFIDENGNPRFLCSESQTTTWDFIVSLVGSQTKVETEGYTKDFVRKLIEVFI